MATRTLSSKADPTLKASCGTLRSSRSRRWRAASLILVHLAMLAHIAHWKITGSTMTPLEPSESMQTLELGYVNAGFLLFAVLILSTLVVGRFFCGWACHVVAYQDFCSWILKKLRIPARPVRARLLFFVPLGAAFYMFAWPTIERMIAARVAPEWNLHLSTNDFWRTFPGPWISAITILVDGFLIVYVLGGKAFCNYGCPYGALFGVADRFAAGRIVVNENCEGCGHCTATCTSNVDVRREVNLYGAVVDPGCMKCMDCVSVCPKGALSFGWSKPSLFAAKPKVAYKKHYDFSWAEELALAGVFLAALFAFRGLYGKFPFLLSLGLAVLTAFAAAALWRRARGMNALAASVMLLFAAHSGFVNFESSRGQLLFDSADKFRRQERKPLVENSREHLLRAEQWGFVESGTNQNMLGFIAQDLGDLPAAEGHFRRAIELEPSFQGPRQALSRILLQRGDAEGAKKILER